MDNTKWKLTGFSPVRKYLWHLLQTELGWSKSNYGGLVPITTPQQQSEFSDVDHPYIVTGSIISQSAGIPFIEQETVALVVSSTFGDDILAVGNLVRRYLGFHDLSAALVNKHTAENGSVNDRKFDIKSVSVLSSDTAEPTGQEGGRSDASIVLRIEYTYIGDDRPPFV